MTGPRVERPLVLLAVDSESTPGPLVAALESLGLEVIVTLAGAETVQVAAQRGPDLCVVAPRQSGTAGGAGVEAGLALCRRLKDDPRTGRLPLLFVSEAADAAAHAHAVAAGADDVVGREDSPALLGARVSAILRLKAAMDALDESARRLRELEKIRDDLMKMIVHDLKTPLSSILATLEFMADGDLGSLGSQQAVAVEDMRGMGQQLLDLIDDLLEVWRIESTTLPLMAEEIVPGDFLAELHHEWTYRFRQTHADVLVETAPDTPTFRGDRGLLRRVFGNLLQNALEHSPAPVALRVSARGDRRGVLFTVSDNGQGIPKEYQEVIFRTFHRLPRPNESPVRGSGLGLAFCRLAVEAHGGRIWVRSEEGQGSAFHVLLPLEPVPPPGAESEA